MGVLRKAILVAALAVPAQVIGAPSGALAEPTTGCARPWDLVDPILWATSVAGSYIGPGLLATGCGDPTLEACLRDPVAYTAAVQSVAGALGVHVTAQTCEPPMP